jgi:hypothetical protein
VERVDREEQLEKFQKQKLAELQTSVSYCLHDPKVKPFMAFLLDTTMVMDGIPAGLDQQAMIELATIHRIGNKLLKVLMEVSPEATGRLLVDITKDTQNENAILKQ